jgi:hypothetical protein
MNILRSFFWRRVNNCCRHRPHEMDNPETIRKDATTVNATRLAISLFLTLFFLGAVCAQDERAPVAQDQKTQTGQTSEPTVTAVGSRESIRFTAPSSVTRIQLQVFRESGEMLFDASNKGNVLDWTLQDTAGLHLGNGSYLCVVTVKSLSGRLSQRIGSVSVVEKQIELQRVDSMQMTAAQQLAVGPVEENGALTILKGGETEAATVVAHDGTQGEITRSGGALSFRLGDFFSGNDQEQMRLTEEGNLGIGTDNPQAKLDVAGVIRTNKGIEFDNGTTVTRLTTTAAGVVQQTLADGTLLPNVAGTGTQNKIAKWTDNAGTLGDSVVTELNSNIGIGTTSPASLLHLAGPSGVSAITLNTPGNQKFRFQTVPAVPNWGALTLNANYNSGWFLDDPATNGWFFKLDTRGGNADGPNNGLWLFKIPAGTNPHTDEGPVFGVSSSQAFFAGNVGIGTSTLGSVLHVVGSQPLPVFGVNGTDAPPVLQVIGGKGGNTTAVVGGTGARVLIQAGDGGDAGGLGGFGGSITLQPGANGSCDPSICGSSDFSSRAGNIFLAPLRGKVGIGTAGVAPSGVLDFKLTTVAGANGLRVETQTLGGKVASFGGNGDFQIDKPGVVAGRFVVKENGNVGIGTTAPGAKLHVAANAQAQLDLQNTVTGGTPGGGSRWRVFADNVGGGGGNLTFGFFDVTNGAIRLGVDNSGNVGIGTTNPSSLLHVDAPSSANPISAMTIDVQSFQTPANAEASHFFRVRDVGSGTAFLIRGDGNVGIGTDSPDRTLTVNGTADKPGGGSWDVFSDERLKSIKGRFTPGLKAVMQLQPLRYEYKRNNALGLRSSGEHVGFGAQAVQRIIPEAVSKNDQGYLLVNNDPILWTMLNAIKEQQQTIEQLKKQNVALEARHAKQETRLAALQTMFNGLALDNRRRHKHQ